MGRGHLGKAFGFNTRAKSKKGFLPRDFLAGIEWEEQHKPYIFLFFSFSFAWHLLFFVSTVLSKYVLF